MPERDDAADKTESMSIVEETAYLHKREVSQGRVRIRTKTEIVEELVRDNLQEEEVDVLRVPIDREVATAPTVRTEGDVIIVPVLEEVIVVEKRLVLKEELHIRRRTRNEAIAVPVSLRKQRALVERIEADSPGTRGDD
jgi:uncharacterized protein (TIGR02271 family)